MASNTLASEAPVGRVFLFQTTEGNETVEVMAARPGGGGGIPAPATSRLIFVSPPAPEGWGDDTTGDGTQGKPYATIALALSTITSTAANKLWDVVLFPGTFTEDIVFPPFIRIIGWDPSQFAGQLDAAHNPARINGTVTLHTSWNGTLSQGSIANVAIIGDVTIDYTAVTSPDGEFSFTGCELGENVTITGGATNLTTLAQCIVNGGDFVQIGGTVLWFGTVGTLNILHLRVAAAVGSAAIFNASGGGWAGDVHADQNAVTDQLVTLNLQGFSTGPVRLTASGGNTPVINAPMGATPENPTLDGSAAVALSPGMRIAQRITVPTGTVINTGMNDITLIVTPGLLGATSIEQLVCSITLQEWQTVMVAQAFSVTPTVLNGAAPEVHLIVMCTGIGFETGFELFVNFWGYLPGNGI